MSERTCSIDGCDKPAVTRGWCQTHYSRWKRTGDVGAGIPVKPHLPEHPADATCAIEGCERSPKGGGRGWCHAHFERWRKNGDVAADVPLEPRVKQDPGAPCLIEGCEKPRASLGWCGMHYERWRTHGDPLFVREVPVVCSVDGCDKAPWGHGFCVAHHAKWLRHGDPEWQRPVLPNSEVNYFYFHTRLREARGSSTLYKCARCDAQAANWAWIHDEDPRDFDSYVPMCLSCHKKYDCAPEWRAEVRRRADGVALRLPVRARTPRPEPLPNASESTPPAAVAMLGTCSS